MKVKELIEELLKLDQELPAFDWDNDEITYVKVKEAEVIAFGENCHADPLELPKRVEIG